MNKTTLKYLLPLLALSATVANAQDAPEQSTPATASPSTSAARTVPQAKRTLWASGLEDPQGIVRQADGSILIAEYGGGRLVRFDTNGKNKKIVASGLKGPAMLARSGKTILIAERKANRVARLNANNTLSSIGGAIEEPLGLSVVGGRPVVVSHTASKILRWDGRAWANVFAASDKKRYGYRCVATEPGGSMLVTDEASGGVLVLTSGGRLATWAKDFSSPSGVVIGPDGATYVCDEGDGTLYKLAADGSADAVASELGKPRGLLFLNASTALVTDRLGSVWRLAW